MTQITTPEAFASSDILRSAYLDGWNHGYGIACHNVPTIGDEVWSDSLGRVTVDADNIREVHADACWQAESGSRDYSPFEFTAHEFNEYGDGGFRICYDHDDRSEEVYATREEAEEAAREEGWGGTDIEEVPSSEEVWNAFEEGIGDAINADLATYTDEDYGIEAESDA